MVQYKDYFSRKEIFYLGIDENKEIEALSKSYLNETKNDEIDLEMKKIYNYIRQSQEKLLLNQNAKKTSNEILNNKVSKRIISAFYDTGILQECDIERFPLDYKLDEQTKTQITVSEAVDQDNVNYEEISNDSPSIERKL